MATDGDGHRAKRRAPRTVFNFSTVRWLERHHRQKKVSRQTLDRARISQLKEMFDHLDNDGSGCIDMTELEEATRFLGLENEQEKVLEQFKYMDADGSGSIDFEEFVTVMTSDMVDQEFFLLQDEQEATKWDLAFFLFATSFRRRKLIDEIAGKDGKPVNRRVMDRVRYAKFRTLFAVPVLPSSMHELEGTPSQARYEAAQREARQTEFDRNQAACLAHARDERRIIRQRFGPLVKAGRLPPFHMHADVVPRKALGTFDRGHWRYDRSAQKVSITTSKGWDLVGNRSVRLETHLKRRATEEARAVLGTCSDVPIAPSRPSRARGASPSTRQRGLRPDVSRRSLYGPQRGSHAKMSMPARRSPVAAAAAR